MRSTCARSGSSRAAWVCAAALALLAGSDGGPASQASEDPSDAAAAAEAVLARVQLRYDSIRDIRARFVQISLVASLGREETARGEVVVRRPGRMRWQYDDPEPSVLVVDGDVVRMYDPVEKRLQVMPVDAAVLSPTALGFLLGNRSLLDSFRAELLEADRDEIGVRLIPRQESGFESLELWVDPHSYQLRESVLRDLFANRTRVVFEAITENAGVPDDAFRVEVPEDAEIIDLRR